MADPVSLISPTFGKQNEFCMTFYYTSAAKVEDTVNLTVRLKYLKKKFNSTIVYQKLATFSKGPSKHWEEVQLQISKTKGAFQLILEVEVCEGGCAAIIDEISIHPLDSRQCTYV